MIKNPIPKVSNKIQFRAIGIVFGMYNPISPDILHKGTIKDSQGFIIDAVVLGKTLSLIKKFINFEKNYYWIVYPRNKNSNNLHLQVAGIWDPNNFGVNNEKTIEKTDEILQSLDLKDNFFSIRGKLIFINTLQKELVIKIFSSKSSKYSKNKSFKVSLKGIIPMKFINSFVSLEATRKENTLFMDDFEIIDATNSSDIEKSSI